MPTSGLHEVSAGRGGTDVYDTEGRSSLIGRHYSLTRGSVVNYVCTVQGACRRAGLEIGMIGSRTRPPHFSKRIKVWGSHAVP